MIQFDKVMLLDDNDNPIGLMPKMEAHEKGLKHSAFSVFILDDKLNMLLQKRARTKYHSGGLWSNACCSHPEHHCIAEEARMRLFQEMGIDTEIKELFTFKYCISFENGIIENEVDTIFVGFFNDHEAVKYNPDEVEDICWMSIDELEQRVRTEGEIFTYWFKSSIDKVIQYIRNGSHNR